MFIQYYYFDNFNLELSTINIANGIFMVIIAGKDMFSTIGGFLKDCGDDVTVPEVDACSITFVFLALSIHIIRIIGVFNQGLVNGGQIRSKILRYDPLTKKLTKTPFSGLALSGNSTKNIFLPALVFSE